MEEFARFVLNDADMIRQLKSLRHELASVVSRLPRSSLLAARDTVADVGTQIGEPSEYARSNLTTVVAAAASRTQQSLRVLEEYSKTVDSSVAVELEQIRYRCYTASATLELHLERNAGRSRLSESRLYVLVDACPTEQAFSDRVTELVQGSVDVLQLRERDIDDRTLLSRAILGAEISRKFGKLFIMNDRPDIAVAADTDGVHVGQDELPVAVARRIVGSQRLIGVSTHSIAQARDAVRQGADYIGCGPVFKGRTKTFDHFVGTSFLKEVAREITIPAFAIGGIDDSNLDQVIEAGVRRIAVSGAVRDASDSAAAAMALKKRLDA